MDEDVLSSREIEIDVRLRRAQARAMDTVLNNNTLLQVPPTDIPLARLVISGLCAVSVRCVEVVWQMRCEACFC
jgi:hypothetical protein